jgi:hypothetical protein
LSARITETGIRLVGKDDQRPDLPDDLADNPAGITRVAAAFAGPAAGLLCQWEDKGVDC